MASAADETASDLCEIGVPVTTMWTRPDAPRDIDGPAVRDTPDVAAWASSMDAGVRQGLKGRTLTQLLFGESVQVLEEDGDWVKVRAVVQPSSADAGGYPGWIRRNHLASPVTATTDDTACVMTSSAALQVDDGTQAEISFGTGLRVAAVTDTVVRVLLPGGRAGSVPRSAVRLAEPEQEGAARAEDILGSARQFLGLRYFWGGTSSWGLDCSGLVHLTYRAHGVVVPRDAFDQADAVEPVPLDDVEPGDLYFFARPGERVYHVGFVTRRVSPDGNRWMLHAPETGEFIEDAPLAPHRLETLVSAGRVRRTS